MHNDGLKWCDVAIVLEDFFYRLILKEINIHVVLLSQNNYIIYYYVEWSSLYIGLLSL